MSLSHVRRVGLFVLFFLPRIVTAQSDGTDDWNAPLISLHIAGSQVFASNTIGIFRAELETRQWQKLNLPDDIPLGGRFGDVPEGSGMLLYLASREFSPSDSEGTCGLYLSPDAGATWSLISSESNYSAALLLPNGYLFAVKRLKSTSRTRSTVHVSQDLGRTWRDITGKSGNVTAIFPDPDHPSQICLGASSVRAYVLHADDEQYDWTWTRAWEWHPEYAQTTRFFSRGLHSQTLLYILQATLNNYFHYGFDDRVCIDALDLAADRPRISVGQGQPVLVPVTIRFLEDLRVKRWHREDQTFPNSPEVTSTTVTLLDSPTSSDLWGIRVDFRGERTAKSANATELFDNSRDRDATRRQILDSATWNEISLTASTPYRRELDLNRLHDFSKPGTYTVQLSYDNSGVADRNKGHWIGGFSSPVFEVEITEKP